MFQGFYLSHLIIVLLPIGALFGAAALVFQLATLTIRAAVSNAVWWSGYFINHPVFQTSGRRYVSLVSYLKGVAWRILGIGLLIWAFIEFRHDYLELLDEGQLGPLLAFVRQHLLTLTILAFLKASITIALFLVVLPVMVYWGRRSRHGWFRKLVNFTAHHGPKAMPLIVYYGLLVVALSLVTNPRIFEGFPFRMSWETFGRILHHDFITQLAELRDLVSGWITGTQ